MRIPDFLIDPLEFIARIAGAGRGHRWRLQNARKDQKAKRLRSERLSSQIGHVKAY